MSNKNIKALLNLLHFAKKLNTQGNEGDVVKVDTDGLVLTFRNSNVGHVTLSLFSIGRDISFSSTVFKMSVLQGAMIYRSDAMFSDTVAWVTIADDPVTKIGLDNHIASVPVPTIRDINSEDDLEVLKFNLDLTNDNAIDPDLVALVAAMNSNENFYSVGYTLYYPFSENMKYEQYWDCVVKQVQQYSDDSLAKRILNEVLVSYPNVM